MRVEGDGGCALSSAVQEMDNVQVLNAEVRSCQFSGVAHSATSSPKHRGAGAFALQIEPRWMQLCSCRRAINNQEVETDSR